MLKVINNENKSILEIKVGDKIDETDFEKIKPHIKDKVNEFGKVNLLMRMNDIPDMSIGAIVEDLKLLKHYNDIEKIAIVGNDSKLEKIVKVEDIIPKIYLKYFNFEEIDKAWNWLK